MYKMVSVYPIRYKDSKLQFLMIKRVTPGYNWQCVTGGVENGELPIEAAKRELFEETGYSTVNISPFYFPKNYNIKYFQAHCKDLDNFYKDKQEKRNAWLSITQVSFSKEMVNYTLSPAPKILEFIKNYHFLAQINELHDPILNSIEHNDWKWCTYENAYNLIMWDVEKLNLEQVNEFLSNNPLSI